MYLKGMMPLIDYISWQMRVSCFDSSLKSLTLHHHETKPLIHPPEISISLCLRLRLSFIALSQAQTYLKRRFRSFLTTQAANGVIGWNESGVWATDSGWQVSVRVMSEVEGYRDVASEGRWSVSVWLLDMDFHVLPCTLCHTLHV